MDTTTFPMHSDGGGAGGLFLVVFGAIALLCLFFWGWMLVDAITNTALEPVQRLIWVIVILFANWLGAVLYYFLGRNQPAAGTRPPAPPR